jgi:hypothetical protein
MTVQQLADRLELKVFHMADGDREVRGGYAGDLLSWVMGKAQADEAWLTIMSNVNVAAVAVLTDVSCVILTESVTPDQGLLEKAAAKDVNLLGSSLGTFELAVRLAENGGSPFS